MSESISPVDTAWELVYAANQEWNNAARAKHVAEASAGVTTGEADPALYERVNNHLRNHELFSKMAGLVFNRDADGSIEIDPADTSIHDATKTPATQNESISEARAQSLLRHIKDERIISNLIKRHEVKQSVRSVFDSLGFVEIDTPILGTAMVEYTKDNFVVHGNAGEFYLPQSPQVYKQALVINSFPRYFQFARCFRDEKFNEPGRTDQLHEFTQIDIEFRCESDTELRNFAEEIVTKLFANFGKECARPFPVIDHQECLAKYGTDKPDLRKTSDELAFVWVVNFPQFVRNEQGEPITTHHPFQMPVIDDISDIKNKTYEIGSSTFDLVLNGVEIGGGDMRINDYDIQREVFDVLDLKPSQFGLLLESLKDGKAPKHGGMAIGLDRITMAVTDTPSIRDVTAFNLQS